jgi:hypothetical protein
MEKRLFPKIVFCLAFIFFIALPMHNSIAHESGGVVGNSYLTFLFIEDDFNLEVFTFDSDGTFIMKRSDGTGTYSYFAPIFEVEWMSTEGDTTYNFTGLSIAGVVIIGWDNTLSPSSSHNDECDSVFFVGIESGIFPD